MKLSIRFFNNREVRAVWDEQNNQWRFSATDVVAAINEEDDYTKASNYWRWLKKKLKNEGIEVVSGTHGFKFTAPDGKNRMADTNYINNLIRPALTNKINDRETFMKGIDYSYYYEQEE